MANSYNDSDGNCDAQLVPFLRELADSIESKQLSPGQLKHVGEFFMNYKFNKELNEQNNDEEFDDMDIVRFISLGWWIYTQILKDSEDSEEDLETNPIPNS